VTMVNARAFNSLSPALQKAVTDAAAAAEKRGWETARAQTSTLTKMLASKGMTVGATPPAIEAELVKIGAVMADDWVKKAGPDGKAAIEQARR